MEKRDIKAVRKEYKLEREKPDHSAKIVAIITLLFLLGFLGFIYGKNTLKWFVGSMPITQPVVLHVNPRQAIDLKFTWESVNLSQQQNLFLNLTLVNNNSQPVKSVEILCTPEYQTGMIQEHRVTIFESIAVHGTKKIPQYDFGPLNDQAKNVNCKVTDVSLE